MRVAANANQVFLAQRIKLKLLGILPRLTQPLFFGQFSGRGRSRLVVIGGAHDFGLCNNGRVALTTPKILEKVQQVARFDGLLLVAPGYFGGLLHGLLRLDGEVFKVHFLSV